MAGETDQALPGLRHSTLNVLALWGQRIGGIVVTLIVTPIITNHFGLELIGIWLLVVQFSNHLWLLDLGLNTSLTRFLSRHRATGDVESGSAYLSGTVLSLIAIGAAIVLATPILISGFEATFEASDIAGTELSWLLILTTLFVGLSLPLRSGIGMLSAVHRFDRLALWETLALLLRLILIIACFHWFEPDLLWLGLLYFMPALLGNAMLFTDGRRYNPALRIQPRLLSRQLLLQVFSVSGAALVITLAAVIVRQTAPMLVGAGLGAAQVALLAFPLLIVSAVTPFVGVGNRLIAPIASQLATQGQQSALYRICILTGRYVLALALFGLLVVHYLGEPLLYLWLGGPKIDQAATAAMAAVLTVLFLGFAAASPGFVLRAVLVSVGHHWHAAWAELAGALIGIALGTLLMLTTNLGIMGMALGVLAAFAIRGVGLITWQTARYFSVSYPAMLLASMARPVLITAAAVLTAESLARTMSIDAGPWLAGIGASAVALLVWAVGCWLWVVDADHKRRLGRHLRTLLQHSRNRVGGGVE